MSSTKLKSVVNEFFAVKKADIMKRVDTFVDALVVELKTEMMELIDREDASEKSTKTKRTAPISTQLDSSTEKKFDTAKEDLEDAHHIATKVPPSGHQKFNFWKSTKLVVKSGWNHAKNVSKTLANAISEPFKSKDKTTNSKKNENENKPYLIRILDGRFVDCYCSELYTTKPKC